MNIDRGALAILVALRRMDDGESHYDEEERFGPGYDGAGFVSTAFEECGIPVCSSGGRSPETLLEAFLECGFSDILDEVNRYSGEGLRCGDVLLNTEEHAAMYLGGGYLAEARCGDRGGEGRIAVKPYYNYPWDAVLRRDG